MSQEPQTQDPELFDQVLDELTSLRSAKAAFTPERLVEYEALSGLAHQTPKIDAWNWIRNNTEALCERNKFARCARLSVFGPGDNVLERLTNAGAQFDKDQRSARTWSNTGLPLSPPHLWTPAISLDPVPCMSSTWRGAETSGPMVGCFFVFWAGHANLRHESIRVYMFEADGDSEFRELEDGEGLVQTVPLEWRDVVPPRGSFTLQTTVTLAVPPPRTFGYNNLVLRFGRQSTLFVRVVNLPQLVDCAVAVNTYRQGVTFSFLPRTAEASGREPVWGDPIALQLLGPRDEYSSLSDAVQCDNTK